METTLLERIASNTEQKSSFYISVNENRTQINTKFGPVIQLDKNKKYEMALVSLETYNSFPNIDASNNKFRYSPNNGATWVDIEIPVGSYEIKDLNDQIQRVMKENGHITLESNNNTLRTALEISKNYKVDFTIGNSIRTVLGFNAQVYSSGYNESENIVNIMNVSSLRITSDIISSSYSNGSTENIIYSFFPGVGPGYKIIEAPVNLIYLPITTNTISSMETKLVDQNGKLINLRGEELSIRFHIRGV
jgi:PHD/YefM family antitoxin component YafN of YafNO toxin-antitoxin module